jgi:hypothetical protein
MLRAERGISCCGACSGPRRSCCCCRWVTHCGLTCCSSLHTFPVTHNNTKNTIENTSCTYIRMLHVAEQNPAASVGWQQACYQSFDPPLCPHHILKQLIPHNVPHTQTSLCTLQAAARCWHSGTSCRPRSQLCLVPVHSTYRPQSSRPLQAAVPRTSSPSLPPRPRQLSLLLQTPGSCCRGQHPSPRAQPLLHSAGALQMDATGPQTPSSRGPR